MDLLYRRYADPISFLKQTYIKGNLSKTIVNIWNAEQEDITFEAYLHSFSDKTYQEYKESILQSAENTKKKKINDEEKIDIVKKSTSILNGFSPTERSE